MLPPNSQKTLCYSCGRTLDPNQDYGRQDLCTSCGRATRCCLNCVHYDPARYNECTEPVADRVVEKEKGNFCDYFKAGTPAAVGSRTQAADAAKKAAEALFKKK